MTQFIRSAIEAVGERLSLEGQLNAARRSLETHLDDKLVKIEEQIPRYILQNAQGIIFLSELSASYGYGARLGTGLIIGKLEKAKDSDCDIDKWSGPISIYTGSLNYGIQYGASKVEHIIILKNRDLVANFMEKGSLQIGVDASFAVGPLGRDAQIGVNFNFDHLSPILSYSVDTKGLFIGVNLEGSMINVRNDCNENFYHVSSITAKDVLSGKITPPIDNDDYHRIVELLSKYCDRNNKKVKAEIENAKEGHEQQLENLKEFTKEKTEMFLSTLAGDPDKQFQEKANELASNIQDKGEKIAIKIDNEISDKQAELKEPERVGESEEKSQQDTEDTESQIDAESQSDAEQETGIEPQDDESKKPKSKKPKSKKDKKNRNSQSQNEENNSTQKELEAPAQKELEVPAQKELEANPLNDPEVILEKIEERISQLEVAKTDPEEERQKIAQAKLKLQQYIDQ